MIIIGKYDGSASALRDFNFIEVYVHVVAIFIGLTLYSIRVSALFLVHSNNENIYFRNLRYERSAEHFSKERYTGYVNYVQ